MNPSRSQGVKNFLLRRLIIYFAILAILSTPLKALSKKVQDVGSLNSYIGTTGFAAAPKKPAISLPMLKEENYCGNTNLLNGDEKNVGVLTLLRKTYSLNCTDTGKFYSDLLSWCFEGSSYIKDVITFFLFYLSNEEKPEVNRVTFRVKTSEPFKIIHANCDRCLKENGGSENSAGYFANEYSLLGFVTYYPTQRMLYKDYLSSYIAIFIHEATHVIMQTLFANSSRPYAADDFTAKEKFQNAKREFFLNLGKLLKLDNDLLVAGQDLDQIYYALKEHTGLDIILAANEKKPMRGDTDYSGDQLLVHIKNKYFKEVNISEVHELNKFIQHKYIRIITDLDLSQDDIEIIIRIGHLFYSRNKNEIDPELIVLIPELIARGSIDDFMKKYFLPLMKYWDEEIHDRIDQVFCTPAKW